MRPPPSVLAAYSPTYTRLELGALLVIITVSFVRFFPAVGIPLQRAIYAFPHGKGLNRMCSSGSAQPPLSSTGGTPVLPGWFFDGAFLVAPVLLAISAWFALILDPFYVGADATHHGEFVCGAGASAAFPYGTFFAFLLAHVILVKLWEPLYYSGVLSSGTRKQRPSDGPLKGATAAGKATLVLSVFVVALSLLTALWLAVILGGNCIGVSLGLIIPYLLFLAVSLWHSVAYASFYFSTKESFHED